MTKEEIEFADFMIGKATYTGVLFESLLPPDKKGSEYFRTAQIAFQYIKDEGLIESYQHTKDGFLCKLTKQGLELHDRGIGYSGFLEEKEMKLKKQDEKEKRDDYFRALQIKDLEEKLNVMNVEQRNFWKAQRQKNLQTTLVAIISALFSFVALLKSWGYF